MTDIIDWHALRHAYGPADDLPGLIDRLTDADAAVRERAVEEAFGSIYHQGTRYPATVPAVGLLVERLGREPAATRDLLNLLACIAVGSPVWCVPHGFRAASLTTNHGQDEAERACYDAVGRRLPAIIAACGQLDGGTDTLVLARLLGLFPAEHHIVCPPLTRMLDSDGHEVRAVATFWLAHVAGRAGRVDLLRDTARRVHDADPLVADAAALGLVVAGPSHVTSAAADRVVRLAVGGDVGGTGEWYELGDLPPRDLAWQCLPLLPPDGRARAVVADHLRGLPTSEAGWLLAAVFDAAFDEPAPASLTPADLTGPQRYPLHLAADVPAHWAAAAMPPYGRVADMANRLGLPRDAAGLLRLLGRCP